MHAPHVPRLPRRPHLPRRAAEHPGALLAAQLLQRRAHVACQGAQHLAARRLAAVRLREPRAGPGPRRAAQEVRPLRPVRRPAPAHLPRRVPDLQGGGRLAAHRQPLPVRAGDQRARGAGFQRHGNQQGELKPLSAVSVGGMRGLFPLMLTSCCFHTEQTAYIHSDGVVHYVVTVNVPV